MDRTVVRCCLAGLALAFFAPAAMGAPQGDVKCTVLASGTYTAESGQRVCAPGTPTGMSQIIRSDTVRFTSASHTVPARLGVRFGLRFVVTGLPASTTVNFRKIVAFPPMRKPDGTVTKGYERTVSYKTDAEGAVTNAIEGYGFDYPYEIVPGEWRFELWYGDRKVTEQVFDVVAQ